MFMLFGEKDERGFKVVMFFAALALVFPLCEGVSSFLGVVLSTVNPPGVVADTTSSENYRAGIFGKSHAAFIAAGEYEREVAHRWPKEHFGLLPPLVAPTRQDHREVTDEMRIEGKDLGQIQKDLGMIPGNGFWEKLIYADET